MGEDVGDCLGLGDVGAAAGVDFGWLGLLGDPQLVRAIVLAVNRFYGPGCTEDEAARLTLWQSHRYDVQAPAVFVALTHESADSMMVEGPVLAEWVATWLPADMRHVTTCAWS